MTRIFGIAQSKTAISSSPKIQSFTGKALCTVIRPKSSGFAWATVQRKVLDDLVRLLNEDDVKADDRLKVARSLSFSKE